MLAKYREAQSLLPGLAPKARPKRDYRRRKRGLKTCRWLPIPGRAYMSSADGATWRSGYATVCKTVYTSSILVVASTPDIKHLDQFLDDGVKRDLDPGTR